jgi:hypothetical protein
VTGSKATAGKDWSVAYMYKPKLLAPKMDIGEFAKFLASLYNWAILLREKHRCD